MTAPQIVWLRRDLRLADQRAFRAAAAAGPVIPVYVLDDDTPKHRKMGGASRWWLHHSLASLARDLEARGSRLILRRGRCDEVLAALAAETGAAAVHALRHVEPWWRNAERAVKDALPDGVTFERHDGLYLMPPGSVTSGQGGQYRIFTPFYRALLQHMPPPEPLPEPQLSAPAQWPDSERLEDWALVPNHPVWAGGFHEAWHCGEAAAHAQLEDFAERVAAYDEARNLPSIDGSSRLSPHLHFGEISPAQVWHGLDGASGAEAASFLRELVWRDYAATILRQFPNYPERSYKPEFEQFEWRDPLSDSQAADDLAAWQQGRTGYPIVDAGMRQLWATGWMHNRVRMIAASFLIKHLLIDWRHGERWFWDTLVDADYGNNGVNWQWSAGCGADANMFGRIMAPLTQSEKFDCAAYIRQWVPELSGLDAPYIHDPDSYGMRPRDYPRKRVGHREGRERALAAWGALRSG
ncbi:deoxyribodipyrimidine photolyase [Erythrobacter sp. SG61-1L]|uniref:cryptochrome/photolyase family protein n=1 Tax=Erythrobacter sp. SG61-1L TaxID=1603897 RepID=UPI0006C90ADF|nr:deoxyribodipyrimidine photo-lyase [Erythrobacter sp. SG61-1L]KPL67790.1 deoxyribodipyrimidine photolyase [Erythrobacter sp. SG61-1L]